MVDIAGDEADGHGGLSSFLGFRHTELTAGRLVVEMDARDELKNPFGSLHGGCLSALVDHCLGMVFYPMIPKGAWVATTEFKLNLMKPVTSGTCVAVTEVVALTKRSGVARIDISNDGSAVCAAQGTVTIVPPRSG
ncbi:MAG: PaaI family thioesterase [Acidimicrobiia bacterium]|nr:PaaI family thioesterase [Acidimicrobiia bacterium]